MRFAHLTVESFKAIRSADIEFGPGLNILYGPNDLGKSTLATAIQAALLVPPGSAEASGYSPWYADATPRVSLSFVDDTGRYWRVKKAFGSENTAELQSSKDGITYSFECKARQVEEKLRAVLAWGIAAPGGKGAPRGLPISFLTNALLAPQTDVESILTQSLSEDGANTGKLRLNKALSTLAQDPVFKKVLDVAQLEVAQCFTPTGRLKRGAGSRFVQASDAVKGLQEELASIEQRLHDSETVEEAVNAQRNRYATALGDVTEAKASLAAVQARLELARAREVIQAKVDEARAAVVKIDAQALRVAGMETEIGELQSSVGALEEKQRGVQTKRAAAEAALKHAEEALRAATSEDGARQRELERAKLETEALKIRTDIQSGLIRREKINTAIAAAEQAEKSRLEVVAAAAAAVKSKQALDLKREQLKAAADEVELARAILAYGRWRVAANAAGESAKAKQLGESRRKEAEAKDAQAQTFEQDIQAKRAKLDARQERLPPEEQFKALQKLERDLALAEAALGGGFSVAVRARGQTVVRANIDGKPEGEGKELPAEALLEAERSIKLTVGKSVDIEVIAGAPEKRSAVETLRGQWSKIGAPVLESAGVASVYELAAAVQSLAADRQALTVFATELERLRAASANLRDQAARYEEQAGAVPIDAAGLARLKGLIGETEEAIFAKAFDSLGKNWEAKADSLHTSEAKRLEQQKEEVAASEQAAKLAEYKAGEAEKQAKEQTERSAPLVAGLGAGEPSALLRTADAELATLRSDEQATQATLLALTEGASGEIAKAEAAVEKARLGLAGADADVASAGKELDDARAAFHKRSGECNGAMEQLQAMDRAGAEGVLKRHELDLAARPAVAAVYDQDIEEGAQRLAEAERLLEQVKQELHTSEGALSKVGGSSLREEGSRVEEALEVARQREKELEVDADAWKLLQETLREVENEEGAHLGRALAQPLTKKFVELTGGRYEGLRIDAALKTEGLAVAGANTGEQDVVEALSVGTRDQLATLIRLTIAEQLKTAIVLDDQLVHTDPARQAWFRAAFLKTSLESQVVVLTCRAEDYLDKVDLGDEQAPSRSVAGGTIRAIDVGRVLKRWDAASGNVATPSTN